jgi:hypothetical protein
LQVDKSDQSDRADDSVATKPANFAEFADCQAPLDARAPDPLVADALRQTIAMAHHAMPRGLRLNRPGGPKESCERLTNPWTQSK